MAVDHRTINVLLASLELEQKELGARMGYEARYLSNVFNGFTDPSEAFKSAFGSTVADLLLGESRTERGAANTLPAGPMAEFLENRAKSTCSRSQFFCDLGLSPHGWNTRKSVTLELVDRVCCELGVHPSCIYGQDYDVEEAS